MPPTAALSCSQAEPCRPIVLAADARHAACIGCQHNGPARPAPPVLAVKPRTRPTNHAFIQPCAQGACWPGACAATGAGGQGRVGGGAGAGEGVSVHRTGRQEVLAGGAAVQQPQRQCMHLPASCTVRVALARARCWWTRTAGAWWGCTWWRPRRQRSCRCARCVLCMTCAGRVPRALRAVAPLEALCLPGQWLAHAANWLEHGPAAVLATSCHLCAALAYAHAHRGTAPAHTRRALRRPWSRA